jgi:hypothetical protein
MPVADGDEFDLTAAVETGEVFEMNEPHPAHTENT